MLTLLGFVAGYLLGGLPSAAVAARLRGRRIFEVGSGSMGAMNTARNLGWALGASVLLFDLGKGASASLLGLWFASPSNGPLPALAAGVGAVVGHLWSPYVGFRGGKGLATTLGVALPLYPLGGLYTLLLLLALLALLRRVTPATLLTALLYPVAVYLSLVQRGAPQETLPVMVESAVLIAALVTIKHLFPSKLEG